MESDQQVVERVNKGDPEAFEILYYRYRDWVYRLAWRFTSHQQDALDALQETFLYLMGKFPGFELTASMTTFLYPAVKHISTTIRAKRRRFSSDDDVLAEIVSPDPEKPTDLHRSELASVLSSLPDERREILLMRYVDNMSLQEIAAALGIPVGTVKTRLHRALRALRDDRRTRDYFLE